MKNIILITLFAFLYCINPCIYANEIEDDYFDMAGNYCVLGDYSSAILYLNKILTINPQNQKAYDLKKGLEHLISGDKKSFVTDVNVSITKAMEYKKYGDELKELDALLEATHSENSYLGYYYLGNYYRDKQDFSKALDSYNSASSARSDFAPAYLSAAIVLLEMGRFNSVINPIDKYLTFNPDDDLAFAVKSRAEFSLGLIDQAEQDNLKALSIHDCPDYQFDRAKILYMQGKYLNSKELFTVLLKDIQTAKIYEYLGLCNYALKDYNQALINFDKAILLSNDDEYLENKYNEIKELLEQQNAQILEN